MFAYLQDVLPRFAPLGGRWFALLGGRCLLRNTLCHVGQGHLRVAGQGGEVVIDDHSAATGDLRVTKACEGALGFVAPTVMHFHPAIKLTITVISGIVCV